MILGIGSDLIDVGRIERTIERHGERFLGRIFTAAERAKAEGRARKVEQAITPAGCEARIDLTITDEGPLAQALVVISAVPRALP